VQQGQEFLYRKQIGRERVSFNIIISRTTRRSWLQHPAGIAPGQFQERVYNGHQSKKKRLRPFYLRQKTVRIVACPSFQTPLKDYVKDALERKLHKLVCAGQLDLKTAQREIASDWIEAYNKYIRTSPPAPTVRETKPAPATSTASEVWVNMRSGKYWKPGSRFYGKTKEGEFMSESEALDRGYLPAGRTGQ
jgi:hypothetical protein